MKPTFIDYVIARHKRRSKPKRPDEHKGSWRDRLDQIARDAEDYGRTSPNADWSRKAFGREMFTHVCSPEVLYAGWEGLKGEAPGVDGVKPEELGRFAAYRQWCEDCGLHGRKRPEFRDTLFARADIPDGTLAILELCGRRGMPSKSRSGLNDAGIHEKKYPDSTTWVKSNS